MCRTRAKRRQTCLDDRKCRYSGGTAAVADKPASSGRKHFPLPVGAPLAEFAAIASQYLVYRVETTVR